ncbi:response regulator [Lachnospiraceae bacterium]|jgi:two-component system response regulator YesN|nr:response regulator [uncultured Schaedlerella sp.]MCI9152865.1 response regulator [Ruminococcus sp.]NBI57227.1 response regulator [Lachnospiraceae bacterium]
MIQVMIVEDEPVTARGLSLMITRNYPDFRVIGTAGNGKEGVRKILADTPDLIFVDINMPVMNGLDMIRQIQEAGFFPRCVILTGYAEFEYARTAIHLGVTDFLLKPISSDTLNEILISCRQKYQKELRILQAEYLQRCLQHNPAAVSEVRNPLAGYTCTLLLLLSGPVCSNIYSEVLFDSAPPAVDAQTRRRIEETYQAAVFPLRGRHYNECLFAVVFPDDQPADIASAARELYEAVCSAGTYLNLLISEHAVDGNGIPELLRNLYLYALFRTPFGYGLIHTVKPVSDDKIHISREIQQICLGIPGQPDLEAVREALHSVLVFCRDKNVTQLQLISDLRYFIKTVVPGSLNGQIVYPDAAEIVSSCFSYEELETDLLFELERIYDLGAPALADSEQSLAKQVRNWLDMNFTSQITFKIFQDIFGHSEKYIASLFKAEFGISPIKYLGNLRIDMAKKLIRSNPDLLLKDVAEMVGYTDAFYFSRVFKSHEGISPSQYAKLQIDSL